MKIYIRTIVRSSFFIAMLMMVSCEDYLERTPDSVISEETAFRNFQNFQGFTEELYMAVPNFTTSYWTSSWNWGDDEIQSPGPNFHFGVKIENGDFWGWQAEHDGWGAGWMDGSAETNGGAHDGGLWPLAWYGIRKANIGLANLDLMTDATEEERRLIEGQLLFFRGWFHFQLIQYFGGMPYIDEVLPSDEQICEPRLSYHESAELVAADLRAAADLLPIDWDNTVAGRRTLGKNDLRINKIMALGYLGKDLLWAASPLMNYESTGSKSYNQQFAQRGASAFGELLSLVESGQTQYELLPFEDYSDNFYTTGQNWAIPGGTEAIFRPTYVSANASNWRISGQYLPSVVNDHGDPARFYPTANYVSFYGMANGMPLPDDITQADPESGYDPEHPWEGRDPRFYHDILYDGVQVVEGSIPPSEENPEQLRYASLYTEGAYRDVVNGSRTGYVNNKFIPLTANRFDRKFDYGYALHLMVPYMRLADVYLMYAEATAVSSGPNNTAGGFNLTAVEAVNVIRSRAGVDPVHSNFTGSLEAFLPELRRERAVELAFERHRFNDLRRWLLLTELPYTIKTSHEFDRAASFDHETPRENHVVNLREELILERDFSEKHYWLPLKVSDVSICPEFHQNPGW
ncbi:RagB/SusD family nutrient uptake outer membrane protein [Autumnicola psychrophila]|uniref:RagB/SusD family nutrient uptake outer membrane protein n=1 Tax=Autumnicola psychrophila TaxID=3075592 RepID=A0ABU3DMT0_9FLAO|nr:RagB/SusD family nutrient uptake outer membrane protein [Zunongwangia sp. F225]MDT0685025.1 RagB/SusD family nutrient uptake outer membrane protein [Zunongwangia sp. F225]